MNNVTIESIIDKLNKINIIDVRESYIHNFECIPNSINIPANYLVTNPDKFLNKKDIYYIYCNMGVTSKRVCEILSSMGYNVINIIGGYNAYKSFLDK